MSRRWLLRVATKMPKIRPGVPAVRHPLAVELAHVGHWFHAVSDTTRLSILEFLSQCDRAVTELATLLDAPQSTVSYHLKVLKQSGLVREWRDGRWKYHGLRGETFQHMIAFTKVVSPGAHQGTCPLDCCRTDISIEATPVALR